MIIEVNVIISGGMGGGAIKYSMESDADTI